MLLNRGGTRGNRKIAEYANQIVPIGPGKPLQGVSQQPADNLARSFSNPPSSGREAIRYLPAVSAASFLDHASLIEVVYNDRDCGLMGVSLNGKIID